MPRHRRHPHLSPGQKRIRNRCPSARHRCETPCACAWHAHGAPVALEERLRDVATPFQHLDVERC
eukprot:5672775-Prymnesium_polylepis.1